jgi:hypothetical protein
MLFLILFTVFLACEKEIDWDIQSDEIDRLVVDAMITNENIQHSIKLSITNQDLNMPVRAVSGAVVIVSDSIRSYEFIEVPEEPGTYYSSPFQAVVDMQYHLRIEYNGFLSEATAIAVPITPLQNPRISGNEENDLYIYLHNNFGTPSMLDLNYNWETVPDYCSSYGNCLASETFYTLDDIDVSRVYTPDKQIIWFPVTTTIIRKKYSLSEDHQKFLRSLLLETEWRGGSFDVEHGNIPTNLSNGALGFFAVCMTVSDTIYVN